MKYESISTDIVMVRAENYRDFVAKKALNPLSKADVLKLKKMPLYFICTRLDVLINTKIHGHIYPTNGVFKIPLYYLDNYNTPQFFDIVVPVSDINPGADYLSLDPIDNRVFKLFYNGKEYIFNISINPMIRKYIDNKFSITTIEYVGLSKASGVKGRFKNGHAAFDTILSNVCSKRKMLDVFILGYNVNTHHLPIDIEAIEASLISYLRPEFNKELKDFPSKDGPAIIKRLKSNGFDQIETIIQNIVFDENMKILEEFKFISKYQKNMIGVIKANVLL